MQPEARPEPDRPRAPKASTSTGCVSSFMPDHSGRFQMDAGSALLGCGRSRFGRDGRWIDFEDAELRFRVSRRALGEPRTHLARGHQFARELDQVGMRRSGSRHFDGIVAQRLGGFRRAPPVLDRELELFARGAAARFRLALRGRMGISGSQRMPKNRRGCGCSTASCTGGLSPEWEPAPPVRSQRGLLRHRNGRGPGFAGVWISGMRAAWVMGCTTAGPRDGGMHLRKRGFRHGLRFQRHLSGDLGSPHGYTRLFGLQIGIAGRIRKARGHASGRLRGTARSEGGILRGFRSGRLASAAFMGGKAPIDFFFPLGRKSRLCAQCSKSPFVRLSPPGTRRQYSSLDGFGAGRYLGLPAGHRRPGQTLLSLEVGDRGSQ